MHREHSVVGIRGKQVPVRREQVHADQHGEEAAEEKEKGDRSKVEQPDALVVRGEKPRAYPIGRIQIMLLRHGWLCRNRCGAHDYFFPAVAGAIPAPFAGTGCDCKDLM